MTTITPWEKNGQTYCPDARRRHADEQADLYNAFRRDGLQMLGRIHPDQMDAIIVQVDAMATMPSPPGVIERYAVEDILKVEQFRALAFMPDALTAVAIHLGALPKILDVSLWRTLPGDGGNDAAQTWHRDVDDWRACKLFVYLTDVGPDQGPHMFVPGSHRPEFFEIRGMVPDRYFYDAGRSPGVAEVVEMMPRIEVTGAAGTTFLANTFAFHRGKPVVTGSRLLFQVMYGLMDLEKGVQGSNIPKIRAMWG